MKFQLIAQDEYNQTQIICTSNSVDEVFDKSKEFLTSENMDNALTSDEQKLNWKAFSVEVLDKKGKVNKNALYGGSLGGKPIFYVAKKNGDFSTVDAKEMSSSKMRFPIGYVVKKTDKITRQQIREDLFAEELDRKTRKYVPIENMDNENLKGKTCLFVKVIK